MKNKKNIFICSSVTLALLIGFTIFNQNRVAASLEEFVDGRSKVEVVSALEQGYQDGIEFAYIVSGYLELDNGKETYRMISPLFYASIAPFINMTHDCFRHVFTGCTAELRHADINVKLTNATTGEVIFDGVKTTYQNGFMGFWLERDELFQIEFEFNGYGGTFYFDTTPNSPTCLTEFQLFSLNN